MIKYIVILYFVGTFVTALQDAPPSPNTNSNQPANGENMNKKIKGIARGIVDKWIAEGLTITRDKVEGWIGKLDEAEDKGKKDRKKEMAVNAEEATTKDDTEGQGLENNDLGGNFEDVKNTLVKTFTKIGEVKCENCKKSDQSNTEHRHINELPKEAKTNTMDDNLENLNVEQLIEKQEAIKQYLQMEKMAKLANVAKDFSKIGNLEDIANLANTIKTLKTTTAKEEL